MENYASELDFNLSGDSYLGAIYSSLAQMLFVDGMSKEQIEELRSELHKEIEHPETTKERRNHLK